MFGDVMAGVSLLSQCRLKFRPYVSPNDLRGRPPRRATHEVARAAQSAYLITGPAFRYSITSARWAVGIAPTLRLNRCWHGLWTLFTWIFIVRDTRKSCAGTEDTHAIPQP